MHTTGHADDDDNASKGSGSGTVERPKRLGRKEVEAMKRMGKKLFAREYTGDVFGTRGDYEKGRTYKARLMHATANASNPTALTLGSLVKHTTPRHTDTAAATKQGVGGKSGGAVAGGGAGGSGSSGAGAAGAGVVKAGAGAPRARRRMSVSALVMAGQVAMTMRATYAAMLNDDVDIMAGVPDDSNVASVSATKRRCAAALRNLSWAAGGELRMVSEGIVGALSSLCESSDPATQRHCAATFRNVSCVSDTHTRMVADGATKALLRLAQAGDVVTCQV